MRRLSLALALLGATLCFAQNGEGPKPWQFPVELRPQMDTALQQFIRGQSEGNWDTVAQLLGSYRRAFSGYMVYANGHKECLIRKMQAFPMIAFDYRIQESPYSSEILTTPPSRRWWTLVGEATYRVGPSVQKRSTYVTAYRDGDSWFFTPPPIDNIVDSPITKQQLAADLKDRVEVVVPADAPVEITDLHVRLDPDNLASRQIEFKLHNKTPKKITAYSFVIYDDDGQGEISVGTGAERDAILPGTDSRLWSENYAAYLYACEGERTHHIRVDDVTFADGTTWARTEPKAN